MTKTEAYRIAAEHVQIIGTQIHMPFSWRKPSCATVYFPLYPNGRSPQQQRAEMIAYGIADLLEAPADVLTRIFVTPEDKGGAEGGIEIYRRAVRNAT
jgi:hypothetical protein